MSFVVWLVWRTIRRSKRRGDGRSSNLPRGVTSKFPFLRRGNWQSLDDSATTHSSAPSYREKAGSFRAPSVEGLYAPDNAKPPQQTWPSALAVVPDPGPARRSVYQQAPADPNNLYPTRAPLKLVTSMADIPAFSHQPQDSFSSTNAAHFAAVRSGEIVTSATTNAGVSPSSYYGPTLLTQQIAGPPHQPSLHRQPSRAVSEVSSLSSGFGEGDLLVTHLSPINPPPPVAASPAGPQYLARFSWMSQAQEQQQPAGQQPPPQQPLQRGPSVRRETVYTMASEDQPARFRSVRSWVSQQTGRIKRAQQRGEDQVAPAVPGNPGIPGIPNPPEEQSLRMMMDDEEKPRKVEDVVDLGSGARKLP